MLVLGRKAGEEIVIPEYGIVLTVLDVWGERVKVGITAPGSVDVYRREVWERIQRGQAVVRGSAQETPACPS